MSDSQITSPSQLPNSSSNPSIETDDNMPLKPKAIQFGAGNIGRGFIAPLLSGAGYTVVFADINQHMVDSLNEEKSYEIHVLDQEQYQFSVDDVMGVLSTNDDVVRAIADPNAHIITTAVGVNVLDRIAPTIAKALVRRREIGGDVMNIIACENTIGATSILKDRVYKALETDVDRAWVTEHIGFADCSVDRIVPPFDREEHDANKLDVGVERFYEWVVCGSALRRPLPPVKGWKLTDNLPSYNERKLFTLNAAHATTAYLGYLKGKTTIEKAILDEEIHKAVHDALEESGAALCKKHGFEPREHKAYIATIIERFKNPKVKDGVVRVGRQPQRKLKREDRLIGPVLMCREYGLPSDHLLVGIAAALLYDHMEDEQAREIQQTIAEKGLEAAIVEYTTLEAGSKEVTGIMKAYETLNATRVEAPGSPSPSAPSTPI